MARKKTVFGSHAEVCHVWANNTDVNGEGRVSSNRVFFRGFKLYSHGSHYVIARKVPLPRGVTMRSTWHSEKESNAPAQAFVVLENCNGYSASTAHHHCHMRRAASQFRTWRVPYATPEAARSTYIPDNAKTEFKRRADHKANLLYLVKCADNERARMMRTASAPEEYARERLRDMARDATEYASTFKLRAPNIPLLQWLADIEHAHAQRAERRAIKVAAWERRSASLIAEYRAGSIDAAYTLDNRAPRHIAERITSEHGAEHASAASAWLERERGELVTAYRAGNDTMAADNQGWRRRGSRDQTTREQLIARTIRAQWGEDYAASAGARLTASYPDAVARYLTGEHPDTSLVGIDETQARQIKDVFHKAHMVAREREKIALWRAGDMSIHFGYSYERNALPVMMRVRGEEFETSLGARFPVDHGRRLLPILLRVRDNLTDVEPVARFTGDSQAMRIGHYRIETIDRSGVRAGCHFVTWEEICHAARLIGMEC